MRSDDVAGPGDGDVGEQQPGDALAFPLRGGGVVPDGGQLGDELADASLLGIGELPGSAPRAQVVSSLWPCPGWGGGAPVAVDEADCQAVVDVPVRAARPLMTCIFSCHRYPALSGGLRVAVDQRPGDRHRELAELGGGGVKLVRRDPERLSAAGQLGEGVGLVEGAASAVLKVTDWYLQTARMSPRAWRAIGSLATMRRPA